MAIKKKLVIKDKAQLDRELAKRDPAVFDPPMLESDSPIEVVAALLRRDVDEHIDRIIMGAGIDHGIGEDSTVITATDSVTGNILSQITMDPSTHAEFTLHREMEPIEAYGEVVSKGEMAMINGRDVHAAVERMMVLPADVKVELLEAGPAKEVYCMFDIDGRLFARFPSADPVYMDAMQKAMQFVMRCEFVEIDRVGFVITERRAGNRNFAVPRTSALRVAFRELGYTVLEQPVFPSHSPMKATVTVTTKELENGRSEARSEEVGLVSTAASSDTGHDPGTDEGRGEVRSRELVEGSTREGSVLPSGDAPPDGVVCGEQGAGESGGGDDGCSGVGRPVDSRPGMGTSSSGAPDVLCDLPAGTGDHGVAGEDGGGSPRECDGCDLCDYPNHQPPDDDFFGVDGEPRGPFEPV